ncbi:hypothetical protein BOC51_21175 [Burkholderia pseudomallei]|nr:hypothetical protein BOC51_21175 [Burkholderia pseudomallei]
MAVVGVDDALDRAHQAYSTSVLPAVINLVTQQVSPSRAGRACFGTFAISVASRVDRRRASAVVDRGVSLFIPFLSLPFLSLPLSTRV